MRFVVEVYTVVKVRVQLLLLEVPVVVNSHRRRKRLSQTAHYKHSRLFRLESKSGQHRGFLSRCDTEGTPQPSTPALGSKVHPFYTFCEPMIIYSIIFVVVTLLTVTQASIEGDDDTKVDNPNSAFSRNMASMSSQVTHPSSPKVQRRSFSQTNHHQQHPHICLAFLSCCDRIDLLNHTLAATIRHMEEDEPDSLRYEIAWVDNGSDPTMTQTIVDSYQIEHALRLPENMGLAYGMNLLIFNLCKAPYILLLEEDWLYLDHIVAPQTEERKRAVATSLALLEGLDAQNLTSYDERNVMGVFLRHETYETFLKFPLMDDWETLPNMNILKTLGGINKDVEEEDDKGQVMTNGELIADIDYRIFCGDTTMQGGTIWGSFTNGAGLYRRRDLMKIGRMYGEPGDAFHDRYIEGNYAFRAAMHNCHSAVRLTKDRSCEKIHDPQCTGAFHHIGGGRGTRPRTTKGTICDDMAWNLFGTPLYEKFLRFRQRQGGEEGDTCGKDQLEELRQRNFRDRGTFHC